MAALALPYGGGGAGFGGAIFNDQTSVTITNTTITGNLAAAGPSPVHDGIGAGAGIFNYNGTVAVNYSTFAQNYAAQGGADIYNLADGVGGDAVLILNDSILADSQGSSEDLHSASNNSGIPGVFGTNNLIMSSAGAPTSSPFLISSADPMLGPLQNNGGPTLTMAPLVGSPVINQGANSAALGVTTDARGLPRVFEYPNIANAPNGDGSDLGAVELQPPSIQLVAGSGQSVNLNTALAQPLQVQVFEDGEPAPGVIVTFAAALSFNPLTGIPEPTASFAGGLGGAEATTNDQGIATAPSLTANGVAGSYLVGADALVAGVDVGPVGFSETNTVPPTVVTGGPYTIAQGQSLSLNASGSTDPYGKTLTYSWTINGHANAATGVNPTLTWANSRPWASTSVRGRSPMLSASRSPMASSRPIPSRRRSRSTTPRPPAIAGLPPGAHPRVRP